MFKPVKEEYLSLLKVYTTILDTCVNKKAEVFLINRIYKILSKSFKARRPKDFPTIAFDLQVVNLITYLKEGKLPYAFLYASSLHAINIQNTSKNSVKTPRGIRSLWKKIRAYFG